MSLLFYTFLYNYIFIIFFYQYFIQINFISNFSTKISSVFFVFLHILYIEKAIKFFRDTNSLEKFKYEVANEVGVNLKNGYNGNISARDAGKIGGNMVKKMIQQAENSMINK